MPEERRERLCGRRVFNERDSEAMTKGPDADSMMWNLINAQVPTSSRSLRSLSGDDFLADGKIQVCRIFLNQRKIPVILMPVTWWR